MLTALIHSYMLDERVQLFFFVVGHWNDKRNLTVTSLGSRSEELGTAPLMMEEDETRLIREQATLAGYYALFGNRFLSGAIQPPVKLGHVSNTFVTSAIIRTVFTLPSPPFPPSLICPCVSRFPPLR